MIEDSIPETIEKIKTILNNPDSEAMLARNTRNKIQSEFNIGLLNNKVINQLRFNRK